MGREARDRTNRHKELRNNILQKEINKPNMKNHRLLEQVSKVNPKYAKHMLHRNEVLEKFAMRLGGGIDLLDNPVCEHCEQPATWDFEDTAYCFQCNKKSYVGKDKKPVLVRDYLLEFTKGFTEEQLAAIISCERSVEDEGIIT